MPRGEAADLLLAVLGTAGLLLLAAGLCWVVYRVTRGT
jgi:hypothetical protein